MIVIKERKEILSSISKYLVADAWFSKKPFAYQIMTLNIHLISQLHDDADLKYSYQGPPTGKRGKPCKYAGKTDTENIDANSQARSENKLNFEFNAALTAINIAKVEHWLSIPKELRKPFSMTDIKTMDHNRLMLQRFIDMFDINAYSAKNRNIVNELIYYGTIATSFCNEVLGNISPK